MARAFTWWTISQATNILDVVAPPDPLHRVHLTHLSHVRSLCFLIIKFTSSYYNTIPPFLCYINANQVELSPLTGKGSICQFKAAYQLPQFTWICSQRCLCNVANIWSVQLKKILKIEPSTDTNMKNWAIFYIAWV